MAASTDTYCPVEMTDSSIRAPDCIRFVLSRTSHPGNIGAAARALGTMGLQRLVLVAPHAFPHADATAMAACAAGLLDGAVVAADLATAIGDCTLVLGATARHRDVALEELNPRQAAQRLLAAAAQGQQVAVLFGNERAGLDNDEIQQCHAAITIPSDPACSSLNLAQAVQVVAWEVRMAWLESGGPVGSVAERTSPLATAAEMEGFFGHLAQALEDIEFHKGRSPLTIMRRLRRLFLRAQPDQQEVQVLRGILADVIRTARLRGTD